MTTRRTFLMQTAATGIAAAGVQFAQAAAKASPAGPKTPMMTQKIPNTELSVSRLGLGCGGLAGWDKNQPVDADTVAKAVRILHTAFDHGITLFDHADIYAYGKSEAAFGEALKQSPGLRDKIVLQSKCGIRLSYPIENPPSGDPHRMDFSREHILSSVEGSLKRLGTDRLDVLLLHRPDALVEPEEVASAFDELQRSGKVRYFGVSNHTPAQIELLKRKVRQPLVVNQLQLSLVHSYLIADGFEANRGENTRITKGYAGASGSLDYCRLNDIQVQAYSPLRGDMLKAPEDAKPEVRQLAQTLADMAKQKNVAPSAVALAWLMRHPAGIVPITGASKSEHIIENCQADRVTLTREEWYTLFTAGAGVSSKVLL